MTCPICNSPIPNKEHEGKYPGALSRYDNKTEVCSNCGLTEAYLELSVGSYRSPNNNKTYTFNEWKKMINAMKRDD